MLSFDPTERITVKEALEHPWLSTYHNIEDEPECTEVFERWREIEELKTLEEFKKALWDEIQDYRREVRGVDLSASGSLQRAGSMLGQIMEEELKEMEPSVSPAREANSETVALPPPSTVDGGVKDPAAPMARSASTNTMADPVVTYARRTSILGNTSGSATPTRRPGIPSFTDSKEGYFPEDPAIYGHGRHRNTIAFPTETYVVPARSRAGSMYGGGGETMSGVSRRLLRTLSTLSIHESGEGLAGGLADIAPIGKFIVERAEDEPASGLPRDFES